MALRTLYQALLDSDPARLRVIAYLWDLELQTSRRTDMAAEIVSAIASAEAVERFIARLSLQEEAAINDLTRANGAIPWTIFERRWGRVRAAGPGRVEREELWRAPVSAAEALWYAGWVHRTFEQRGERAVEMAFLPEDLALYVDPPPPTETPTPPETAPPEIGTYAEDTLADDLVTLWSAVQRAEASSEALLPQLHAPADQRLAFLRTLSVESDWLREGEDGQLQPVPKAIVKWLQADPWSQWSSLIDAWMTSRQWNDLAYVETLTPDPVNGWPHNPQDARQAFLEIFAHCDPGKWYGIAAFVDYVKVYATDFLRPDGDYDSWAPRDACTDTPLRGFDAWDAVEGALVRFFISGPLHWLGLTEMGQPQLGGAPVAFRLTPAAAAILLQAEPPTLSPPSPVKLEAMSEFIVPPRRRYDRFQLSRVADAVSAPNGYRYRLSPSSLRRAKEQRIAYERIITFLRRATQADALPRSMIKGIQRIYQDNAGASLARRWILIVPDAQLLTLPALEALIDERLTDTIVTLRSENRARAVELLLEQGLFADVEDD
jgi:hypothetical protein